MGRSEDEAKAQSWKRAPSAHEPLGQRATKNGVEWPQLTLEAGFSDPLRCMFDGASKAGQMLITPHSVSVFDPTQE